jgi:hypothetical protein
MITFHKKVFRPNILHPFGAYLPGYTPIQHGGRWKLSDEDIQGYIFMLLLRKNAYDLVVGGDHDKYLTFQLILEP